MKLPKPFTYAVCLLSSTSVFAASVAPTAAAIAAKTPAAAVAAAPKPLVTTLRIASLNGKTNPNHKKEIQMRPQDQVVLTADLFATVKGKLVGQNSAPTDFIWQIENREACDMARPASCESSGIQVGHDGISFVLPENMGETVKIKVRAAADAKKSDQLVIRNRNNVEARAEQARVQAEEQAEQARYEQQQQDERNSQIVSGIFGAVIGGLSAYGQYKAEEQHEERREEYRNRARNQFPNGTNLTIAPAPAAIAPPAPVPVVAPRAPAPAPVVVAP
ncbi:MAG: hypothetical protein ACXWQO_05000, partial [Bdellovibrionota bacterium]